MKKIEKSIDEILIDYIETSSTALDILARVGFSGNRKELVAAILQKGTIQPPPDFPCSQACITYGRAIAEYILTKERRTER